MNLVPAKSFDVNTVMQIERSAFIPAIQESQKTFEKRLSAFPEGFLLLQDSSTETVLKNGGAVTAGYFCSEIWNSVPDDDNFFALGHDPEKVHKVTGPVLYASSFALFPEYRGRHLAKPFFEESLKSVCGAFPDLNGGKNQDAESGDGVLPTDIGTQSAEKAGKAHQHPPLPSGMTGNSGRALDGQQEKGAAG